MPVSPPRPPRPVPSRDALIACALSVVVFAVYAATMCRTVYTGDDGDFLTAMATGGISHPTGYPLFTLVGHLFLVVLRPVIAEPAARINLMTALFGAAAIGFFYRFLREVLGEQARIVAAGVSLVLGFAPTLWQQCLSCEVYSLTCLYLSALLWMGVRFRARPADTPLLARMTFLYGLALTNHLTIVLFLPGFLVYVISARPTVIYREGAVLIRLVGLFVLPLSLYLYLPLAAKQSASPVLWSDPSGGMNFLSHITGQQYGNGPLPWPLLREHLGNYAHYLTDEMGPWLLWLVPVGVYALWRRGREGRALCLLLLFIWLADVAFAANYNIFDIYVYYIPSYLVAASFVAIGVAWCIDRLVSRTKDGMAARRHYAPLFACVVAAATVAHASLHWADNDKSGNFLEADFSENILRNAPPRSVLVTSSNTTFSLWYRRFVLHERTDVTILDWNMARGMWYYDAWYFRHLARQNPYFTGDIDAATHAGWLSQDNTVNGRAVIYLLARTIERGDPVLLVTDDTHDSEVGDPRAPSLRLAIKQGGLARVPWGLTERLYSVGHVPDSAALARTNRALWQAIPPPRGLYTGWAHNDPLQDHIPLRYALAQIAWGKQAEQSGWRGEAVAAYTNAERLYHLRESTAGLARLGAALPTSSK